MAEKRFPNARVSTNIVANDKTCTSSSRSPNTVDPVADRVSVSNSAPAIPTESATTRIASMRSRNSSAAITAVTGGERLINSTTCAALVYCAARARKPHAPGPNATPIPSRRSQSARLGGTFGRARIAISRNSGSDQAARATNKVGASKCAPCGS